MHSQVSFSKFADKEYAARQDYNRYYDFNQPGFFFVVKPDHGSEVVHKQKNGNTKQGYPLRSGQE